METRRQQCLVMCKGRIFEVLVFVAFIVTLAGCAYNSRPESAVEKSDQVESPERKIERESGLILQMPRAQAKFRCPGIDLVISRVEVLLEADGSVVALPYLKNRCGGRGSGVADFLFEASGSCGGIIQPYFFNIGPGEEIRMGSALGFCNERADPPVSVGDTFTVTADYNDRILEFNEGNNSCVVIVRHGETSWWEHDCLAH